MNPPFDPQLFFPAIGLFIFIYLIILGGVFVLFAFYFKTMIDVMTLVRPKNRETGVGNIMFNVIPLFNLIYGFIVYPKICDSIAKEYRQLGLPGDKDFGKNTVIAMQILMITMMIPVLNALAIIPLLIVAILFWVKIDGYKKKLELYNKNGFADDTLNPITSSSPETLD